MPRNGSGTYTVPITFTAGTSAKAGDVNTDFTDVGTALTGSLPRDGQAGMTGQFQSIDGTTSAPGVAFGSDPATGIYRSAAGTMNLVSSGTTVLTVSPTGIAVFGSSNIGVLGGKFRNLNIVNSGSTQMAITVDAITLNSSGSGVVTLSAVSISPSITASGVNGLDVGSAAANTWYSEWVIYNPTTTTVAGLFSLSATAPTFPSGYTFYARVGWARTQSASTNLIPIVQKSDQVQYTGISGALPSMGTGAVGSVTTPTWVAISLTNFFPTTAAVINLACGFVGSGTMIAAPNNTYGAYNSGSIPPPINLGLAGGQMSSLCQLVPESSNIYWASNGSGYILAYGWKDNL